MDLERRQFLKLGLAATASVAATGAAGFAMSGRHVSRTTTNFHSFTDSACRMCPAGCGIRIFTDKYGGLVTITGIPGHPVNNGKICAKGMAAINLHYHPERLVQPLERKGERASEFDAISYSDAISKASVMVQNAKDDGAMFVVDTEDDDVDFYRKLFADLGVNEYRIISHPIERWKTRAAVNDAVFGTPEVQPSLEDAGAIIIVGANPFEGGPYYIAQAKAIVEAMANNRAKLIVIDPVNTNTAGRADQWLPIKPESDNIMALYLLKLVLGESHPDLPAACRRIDEAFATGRTGLDPDQFKRLAKTIKKANKISIIVGDGIYRQDNGDRIRYAFSLLEKAGGGEPFFAKVTNPDPDNVCVVPNEVDETYGRIFGSWLVFYISHRSNPVYEKNYGARMMKALRDKSSVVGHLSIGSFVNETNRFADLVIPELLPLESWGIVPARWQASEPTWTLQEPINPLYPKVRSTYEIMVDIAKNIGMAGFASTFGQNRIEHTQIRINNLDLVNKPQSGRNIFIQPNSDSIANLEIPTGEVLDRYGETLPEIGPVKNFHLVVSDSNVMNAELANCKWLSEIAHKNDLRINSADAKRLGIRQGDKVRITSDKTTLIVSADVCESVARGVVAMGSGFGHSHYGKIAAGKRWRDTVTNDPDTWLIWWGQYGNGSDADQFVSGDSVKVTIEKA